MATLERCSGGGWRVEARQTRASEVSPSRIVIVPSENTHLCAILSHTVYRYCSGELPRVLPTAALPVKTASLPFLFFFK